jgi:hypothetical protein
MNQRIDIGGIYQACGQHQKHIGGLTARGVSNAASGTGRQWFIQELYLRIIITFGINNFPEQ